MLGKLDLNSIPYQEPIVMITIFIIFLIGLGLIAAITYYKKWIYLWKEWLTSVDHKKIGIMYIIIAFIMMLRGFADAIMMRAHQAIVSSGQSGFLNPHHYDQIITAHGVIMIIFMATPFIVGLMNLIIPLQIGARDVAFPFLNSLSFWLFMVGVILINLSLGIGEFAQTGWAAYPPLSEIQYSPGVGVDYWIWSIQISGIGTTLTGINFFVTILRMRAPNMPMMKMPVFTWTSFCTNILIIAAFPILTVTIFLLTLDRYLNTHFFTNDMGGNMMMYINLFWAWGHPEVYILVLPVFGIFSEIVATFSKKSLFGYTSLVWATIAITLLSFCVWLHHFFTMGSGADVNSFFGIMTMIIAIPTGVKVFNWIFTMYRGKIKFHSSMLWTIGFIITFSIGGMTGVLLSVPGADFVLHNSLFLIGHFHNVIIGGVVFGCFAGMTYWFPKACGFIRLSQNIDVEFHLPLSIAAFGTFLIALGILCQIIQLLISIKNRHQNRDLTGDPWNGRTLEWSIQSPPPLYNFAIIPNAYNMRDAFWFIKNKKDNKNNLIEYKPIHMPKNTSGGIFIAIFSLIFGFAMVWHIWWMSIFGIFGILFVWVFNSFQTNQDYYIPVKTIHSIENSKK
uniref:Cytochrome c oxidase subunit 1 n=1 Tax=Glossina palpalis gambiensis TaxID=67801 RepID=A0A1B0C1T1_9MUSC